jgi:hypothetical protein
MRHLMAWAGLMSQHRLGSVWSSGIELVRRWACCLCSLLSVLHWPMPENGAYSLLFSAFGA